MRNVVYLLQDSFGRVSPGCHPQLLHRCHIATSEAASFLLQATVIDRTV